MSFSTHLYGTAAQMASRNPLVPKGALAGESDTGVIKMGNGVTRYNSLLSSGGGSSESVSTVAASTAALTLVATTTATIHNVTLTANCTLTFPTLVTGATITLVLTQDGTGSRTVTWPATVQWPAGTAPSLSTGAGKTDVLTFTSFAGTAWAGSLDLQDVR